MELRFGVGEVVAVKSGTHRPSVLGHLRDVQLEGHVVAVHGTPQRPTVIVELLDGTRDAWRRDDLSRPWPGLTSRRRA